MHPAFPSLAFGQGHFEAVTFAPGWKSRTITRRFSELAAFRSVLSEAASNFFLSACGNSDGDLNSPQPWKPPLPSGSTFRARTPFPGWIEKGVPASSTHTKSIYDAYSALR